MRVTQRQPPVETALVPLAYAAGTLVLGFALPRVEHAWFPSLVLAGLAPSSAQAMFGAVASGMMALTGIVFAPALNGGATARYEFQAGGLARKIFGSWRFAMVFDASYRPNLSLLVGSALATAVLTRSLAGVSILSTTNPSRPRTV